MHALAKLKARAEADQAFDSSAVKIATKDFDPRYWLRWAHGLGYFIHLWADNGIGFGLPRGVQSPAAIRSDAALMAAYNNPGNGRKLRRYLAALIPEHDIYVRLDIRWRRMIDAHAKYLPCVLLWKGVQVTNEVSIPEYVFSSAVIDADIRSDEFKQAKKMDLADRQAFWARQIKFTPPARQKKFNAAWRARQRAETLREQANKIASLSVKKAHALTRSHRPLPIAGAPRAEAA